MNRLERIRKRRGSILFYTVIMLVSAGVAVMAVTRLVRMNLDQVHESGARLQALYAAESGIQQTIDWFNRGYYTWYVTTNGGTTTQVSSAQTVESAPLTLASASSLGTLQKPTPSPTNSLTPQSTSSPSSTAAPEPITATTENYHTWDDNEFPDSSFQNFFHPDTTTGHYLDVYGVSTIKTTLDVAKDQKYASYLPTIADSSGNSVATITTLRIIPPQTGDPKNTIAQVYCEAKVRAFDRPKDRDHYTVAQVHVWLYDNRLVNIKVPAAIMSRSTVVTNGQFNVHWGEVWSTSNLDFPNTSMNGVPTQSEDQWYEARSEQNITINGEYADGTVKGGTSSTPVAASAGNYYVPYLESLLDPSNWRKFDGRENLHQHATDLKWPDYDYKDVKSLARQMGIPIFGTTSEGHLYLETSDGREENTFEGWFNGQTVSLTSSGGVDTEAITPDTVDPEELPPMYFIDTVDGEAPAADGSNLATIDIQGNKPFMYGLFFGAANFNFGGAGDSPTLVQAEKPDLTEGQVPNCRIQGLLYSYGWVNKNGQGSIYGAVYANRGYGAGGCPDIYYDWRLQDILRNRLGSSVKPMLWEYKFYQVASSSTP